MTHHRLLFVGVVGSAAALVAATVLPAAAQAVTWGGPSTGGTPNVNYAYPDVTILFRQAGSRVNLRNFQVLLACTDRNDGVERIAAFDAGARTGYAGQLRNNRVRMHFASSSGGLRGVTNLTARMRPNGTGRARVGVEAGGRDSDTGAIMEDCSAEVSFRLQRFRAGRAPAGSP